MSEIKLLHCPFCGGEFEEINNTSCKQGDNWLWSTECMECGLFIEDKDKENLIKRINTRKPMERILTRLEEYNQSEDDFKKIIDTNREIPNPTVSRTIGRIEAFNKAIEIVKEEGGIE